MPPHRIRNIEDYEVTHYVIELVGEPSPSELPLPAVTNGLGESIVDIDSGDRY